MSVRLVCGPERDQPIHKRRSASATIATPSTTDTAMKPPMFHVSGFSDGRTQNPKPSLILLADVGTDLAVSALEVSVAHDGRAGVPRPLSGMPVYCTAPSAPPVPGGR